MNTFSFPKNLIASSLLLSMSTTSILSAETVANIANQTPAPAAVITNDVSKKNEHTIEATSNINLMLHLVSGFSKALHDNTKAALADQVGDSIPSPIFLDSRLKMVQRAQTLVNNVYPPLKSYIEYILHSQDHKNIEDLQELYKLFVNTLDSYIQVLKESEQFIAPLLDYSNMDFVLKGNTVTQNKKDISNKTYIVSEKLALIVELADSLVH